jgi:hypothetical protein
MIDKQTKKNRKFIVSYWKISLNTVILWALFAVVIHAEAANEEEGGRIPDAAGMTVRVKMKEAKTLDQLSLLRDELRRVQHEKLLLARDGKALDSEKKQLSKELIDILNRYREQNESWNRLQLSVAATLASAKMHVVGKREDQLLKSLKSVSDSGRSLALKTIEFCDYVESIIDKMPLSALEKAKIKLRSDGLRRDSGRLCAMSAAVKKPQTIERCRLFEVNDRLRIVVLPVGWVHGVRNGLVFYTGKDNSCRLQVIAARPFISAAIVKEGNIKELAPGMVASVNRKIK